VGLDAVVALSAIADIVRSPSSATETQLTRLISTPAASFTAISASMDGAALTYGLLRLDAAASSDAIKPLCSGAHFG